MDVCRSSLSFAGSYAKPKSIVSRDFVHLGFRRAAGISGSGGSG
jgi:hypothetical protein